MIKLKEGSQASIILDVAISSSSDYKEFISIAQKQYKLKVEVISRRGPSGWPEVKFTGDYKNLRNFFLNEYDDDENFF